MKLKSLFLAAFFVFISTSAHAQYIDGKVTDVSNNNDVVIQLEGGNPFRAGNKIDITYKAGVIVMLIGSFEVTSSEENIINAKPISLNMPANKGMKVQVIIALDNNAQVQVEKDGEKYDTDPFGFSDYDLPDNFKLEDMPDTLAEQEDPDFKAEGKVIKVMGNDVLIELTENKAPKPGYTAELFFITSQGLELEVGKWKVTETNGQQVTATCTDCGTPAREGLKAKITGKILK